MKGRRKFAGRKASVKQARHWAAAVLFKAGVDVAAICEAEQVISELCTNSLRHSRSGEPGGSFTVRILRGASRVRLEVADQGGPSEPMLRRHPAEELAESGMGLALVEQYALDWWVRGGEHGRTVFAELDARERIAVGGES